MKRYFLLFLTFTLFVCLCACDTESDPAETMFVPATESTEIIDENELIILYTNDVHNAYLRDDHEGRLGYAAVTGYKRQLEKEEETVLLIDGGDAIQGEAVGTLTDGSYIVDIMNEMDYFMAVPGNHEFDFGMDNFLELSQEQADYDYICCNFIDLRSGEPVFTPYKLETFDDVTVAFVGVATPETIMKSTPAYFQDAAGNDIYGFAEGNGGQDLYDCVQQAIDDAVSEGADYVIGIGHLGTEPSSTPWTSVELIMNTTGMTAFLDGHSHSLIEGEIIQDMDDRDVLLCSGGSKLVQFVQLRLDLNSGEVESKLIQSVEEDDAAVQAFTQDISLQFEDLLEEVVATSEVALVVNDPDEGDRLVRKQETNLGDLIADAYRIRMDADIGMVNGGGIREGITEGSVTYGDILSTHPFGNAICVVEATGQEIMDALEMAYRSVGVSEEGSFQHVSGLTCVIDTSVESTVKVDSKENFVSVEGQRRVKEILIGGRPIDPKQTYTVASHDYLLKKGGGGLNMFMDNTLIKDCVALDNQVLIDYIQQDLGGRITAEQYGQPYGEGRIMILEGEADTQ